MDSREGGAKWTGQPSAQRTGQLWLGGSGVAWQMRLSGQTGHRSLDGRTHKQPPSATAASSRGGHPRPSSLSTAPPCCLCIVTPLQLRTQGSAASSFVGLFGDEEDTRQGRLTTADGHSSQLSLHRDRTTRSHTPSPLLHRRPPRQQPPLPLFPSPPLPLL